MMCQLSVEADRNFSVYLPEERTILIDHVQTIIVRLVLFSDGWNSFFFENSMNILMHAKFLTK